MTSEITDTTFSKDVLAAPGPVVVDFWAEWCPPCDAIVPALEELSSELQGKVTFVKLNIDDNPRMAAKYGVRSIPTLLMFKQGEPMAIQVGAMPKGRLSDWVKKSI